VVNIQGGPQFYPFEHGKTRFFVHALGGSALVDGAAPHDAGFIHGWLVRPSFAFGAGFEQGISNQFALRFNGDYLRTAFFNTVNVVIPQNNVRLTVSVVFRKSTGVGAR
jgi:hypothetical protein